MRHIILYLIIIAAFSAGVASGQTSVNITPQVLEKLFRRLLTNYEDSDRLRINDSINSLVENYVKSDTVFNCSFKNLHYLGQITSPDSLLKIVTWNLVLGSGQSSYFCYLIRKEETGNRNRIYRLSTVYSEAQVLTDTTYNGHNWYGALYYDVKPYQFENRRFWILLGIDYGNPFITRKIIDVLSFTKQDSIIFGKKWFDSGDKKKFRDVFEYASNGMMSLRFSSDSSIVFDHLVPFSPDLKDDRQYYGPDFSYDSYFYKDGIWKLKINVDARNKE
ncbi:MAG: hypothetical protein EPN88_11590 [Bacteroidetes bacterium]|nr:MAG: hypothetical protein EPN88_11590 [Bacteroidota bacterium]